MNANVTAAGGGAGLGSNAQAHYFQKNPQKRATESPVEASAEQISQAARVHADTLGNEQQANRQVAEAVSFTQTQQGFLQIVGNALDRMGELSTLCQDETRSDADRAGFTAEFTQLQNFISDVGGKRFNGFSLFSGNAPAVKAEGTETNIPLHGIEIGKAQASGGLVDVYDPKTTDLQNTAARALRNIQTAISNLGEMQAKVGANLQRLRLSSEQLSVLSENLTAANCRINDLDLARSITVLTRQKMLMQLGAAMQTQANVVPSSTLKLLD